MAIVQENKFNVVLVEDNDLVQMTLKKALTAHNVFHFPYAQKFLEHAKELKEIHIILLDLCHAGDPHGEAALAAIPVLKNHFPEAELVIQSAVEDVAIMRACVKNGASRFVMKEHMVHEIPILLGRYQEVKLLQKTIEKELIGRSEVMKKLRKDLLKFKIDSAGDVLIEGETGTGKELCARSLHGVGPFVAVNVSAIPHELFEAEFFGAEKGAYTGSVQSRLGHFESTGVGTLFLDEVQNLRPDHQAKLLRVLETRTFTRVGSSLERSFQCRVVCASNQNLREAVQKKLFREDLYYRIAALQLHIPPLRVRGADIGLLAEVFLKEFDTSGKLSFTEAGLSFLEQSYDWPGNVRELRGLIRNLVLATDIPRIDVPEISKLLEAEEKKIWQDAKKEEQKMPIQNRTEFEINWSLSFDENVEKLESYLLSKSLHQGKSSDVRERLKLTRSRFYEKLNKYGLLS